MNDEQLILLVQANECLYNKNCMDYKMPEKKKKVWLEISAAMQLPEEMVAKRWACLRDRYAREKRQQSLPSGSGLKMESNWPLMRTMDFIDPFIVPRATRCSYNICDETPLSPQNSSPLLPSPVLFSSSPAESHSQTFAPIEPSPTTPLRSKRKRHETTEDDNNFSEAVGAFKKLCESHAKKKIEEEKDPLHGFGQMIVATIGSMNPAKQIMAMQKVTALVMEMKLEAE